MSEVRFVADAMLGRLARHLRFLGFDVLYLKDMDDSQVVRIARAEGRVLLTRDRGIPGRFKVPCVLIESEDLKAQLRQVLEQYPPEVSLVGTRCLKCNALLLPASKEEVTDGVPEYVLHNQRKFFRCPQCGRLYWEGSHVKKLLESMDELIQETS